MVSASQMGAIVAATMTRNNKANESLSLSLLKSYEGGSALAIDSATYVESAHDANRSCLIPPFGVKVLQVMARSGKSYPAQFIALGDTYQMKPLHGCTSSPGACPDAGTILVFSRPTAAVPWTIVVEPSADNGDSVRLRGDGPDGTGAVAAPLPPAGLDANAAPAGVAKELQGYELTGHLGSLKSSDFTGTCWAIPDPRAAYVQYQKSLVDARETYSPAPGVVSYTTTAGSSVLSLFTLDFETTLVPIGAGASIDWISDPADPVTALLPTGGYSRIVEKGSLEIAAVVSGAGSADVSIIGAYGGVTSISGTSGSTGPSGGGGGGVLVSYAG